MSWKVLAGVTCPLKLEISISLLNHEAHTAQETEYQKIRVAKHVRELKESCAERFSEITVHRILVY